MSNPFQYFNSSPVTMEVLEAVVTAKRDKAGALTLLKRIMKKYGRPQRIVTDCFALILRR
jgi:transposase-like protein